MKSELQLVSTWHQTFNEKVRNSSSHLDVWSAWCQTSWCFWLSRCLESGRPTSTIWTHLGVRFLVDTALDYWANKAPKTWASFIRPVSKNRESHKTSVRIRQFSLKREKGLSQTHRFNRALPEKLMQRKGKHNKAHCSSSDSADYFPVSGPRYVTIPPILGKRPQGAELWSKSMFELVLYWYQALLIKPDPLLPKSEPELLDWLQNFFFVRTTSLVMLKLFNFQVDLCQGDRTGKDRTGS